MLPDMEAISDLIGEAERYCAARGISLWRLGALAVNDGKFFHRLKGGGGCTIATLGKARRYMAENPIADSEAA